MAVIAVVCCIDTYTSKGIRSLPAVRSDFVNLTSMLQGCGISIAAALENVGRTQLLTSLREHCLSVGPDHDLLIVFSGHGQSYKGRDYLVPADAIVGDDFDNLGEVLVPVDLNGAVHQSTAASITMIIDACRDGVELSTKKAIDYSTWKFTKIKPGRGNNCIVFGCGSGQYSSVISDTAGSLFTASLCEVITERRYGAGTIREIMEHVQATMNANSLRYAKPRQELHVAESRKVNQAVRALFPPGTIVQVGDRPRDPADAGDNSTRRRSPTVTLAWSVLLLLSLASAIFLARASYEQSQSTLFAIGKARAIAVDGIDRIANTIDMADDQIETVDAVAAAFSTPIGNNCDPKTSFGCAMRVFKTTFDQMSDCMTKTVDHGVVQTGPNGRSKCNIFYQSGHAILSEAAQLAKNSQAYSPIDVIRCMPRLGEDCTLTGEQSETITHFQSYEVPLGNLRSLLDP